MRAGALLRGMACVAPVYRPRDAEHTVLHQVISAHLETFLNAAAEAGDGAGLPQFVEREFRESRSTDAMSSGISTEPLASRRSVTSKRCLR